MSQPVDSGRLEPRFEVRLSVRFVEAKAFVEQYAHNLSKGGLFLAGATDLTVGQRTRVALELPGFDQVSIECEVVHVLPPGTGRVAGAGLKFVNPDPSVSEALSGYLLTLGRRRDGQVLVYETELADELLRSAGYSVERIESPDALEGRELSAVLAIVVTEAAEGTLLDVLAQEQRDLLFRVDPGEPLDALLSRLDAHLVKQLEAR